MLGNCIVIGIATAYCLGGLAIAQERAHSEIKSDFAEFVEPDFPFFSHTLDARAVGGGFPGTNLTPRGIILHLGSGLRACFDTDLLRVALFWKENAQGEYLTMGAMGPGSYRVPGQKASAGQKKLPKPIGEPFSATGIYAGWQAGELNFDDPRPPAPDPEEVGRGPLAEELGRWDGISPGAKGVLLAYTVGGTRVLEEMRGIRLGKEAVPMRLFRIGPHADELSVVLDERSGDAPEVSARCESGEVRRLDGRLVVSFPPNEEEKDHVVVIVPKRLGDGAAIAVKLAKARFDELSIPGVARWPKAVRVACAPLSSPPGEAFVIDEIPLPAPNPWKRNVRLSGLDFFSDGRAALCTFDGDVWIVDGIDASKEEVNWRRHASGLHEPMGLQVVDDEIYVFDRNGIMRFHDVNRDGEADFYENFSNAVAQTAETREFANDLVKKPGGGFYIAKGGQVGTTRGKYNGTVVEIAEDGRTFQVVARGLRQPYIGVDPETGRVTSSDQQGHWVPATPLRLIEPGSYHGFIPTSIKDPVQTEPITEPPLWIPHIVNQSGASQVTLRGTEMGPLDGALLHIGYNRPELFRIYLDESGAMPQGAAASAVTGFPCALLKGAVNPVDGQLYVCGFRIWGTALDQISGLFRVRHTGATSRAPREVRSGSEGVLMQFDFELEREIAMNPSSYTVERWNYRRTKDYGSGHYRLDGEPGQESMPVTSVYLSADKRSVFLGIPDMQPVHSMRVTYRLAQPESAAAAPPAASGATALAFPVVQSVYLTVHELRRLDLAAAGFGDIEVDLTVKETAGALAAIPDPSVEEGQKVAEMIGCIACHTTDGSTLTAAVPGQVVGPSWKGLYGSRRELADGSIVKKVDEVYLKESILDPASKMAKGFEELGVGMPSYLGVLQDWQIDSVILFIKSLK